jgi:serine protease AprX
VRSDVRTADFSSIGNGQRRPDVAAPGARVLSARVPGSHLDQTAPAARRGEQLFRGSGTSQAAAAVSGAAALLLQQRPELRPAELKELLLSTAFALPEHQKIAGRGLVDVAAAAAAPTPRRVAAQKRMSGTGSLDAARGSVRLVESDAVLHGERDIFGTPFDSAAHARLAEAETAWSQGTWNGNEWAGPSWSGVGWAVDTWEGKSWSGKSWSGKSWSGKSWSGKSWSGKSWSGNTWSGKSWSGKSWSGDIWSGKSWSGKSWSGDAWSGKSWSSELWAGKSWSGKSWSGETWYGKSWG